MIDLFELQPNDNRVPGPTFNIFQPMYTCTLISITVLQLYTGVVGYKMLKSSASAQNDNFGGNGGLLSATPDPNVANGGVRGANNIGPNSASNTSQNPGFTAFAGIHIGLLAGRWILPISIVNTIIRVECGHYYLRAGRAPRAPEESVRRRAEGVISGLNFFFCSVRYPKRFSGGAGGEGASKRSGIRADVKVLHPRVV